MQAINTLNSGSVFIGCDVATAATGWKHSIMLGTNAGAYATTPNVGLATDTACTFIGYQAGYSATGQNQNNAMGYHALYQNAGTNNVAIGWSAIDVNTTGGNNVGVGVNTLEPVENFLDIVYTTHGFKIEARK